MAKQDQLIGKVAEEVQRVLAESRLKAVAKRAIPAPATPKYKAPKLPPKNNRALAPYIDHTLLKPAATEDDIVAVCKEALEYSFASVCVNPMFVPLVARALKRSKVKVCCVVGFPLGANASNTKAFEATCARESGARELDMVLSIGELKQKDYAYVYQDILAVVRAAGRHPVKVIFETAMLTEEEKIVACLLSKAAGARFVKTCTGFGGGGATVEDIALMRRVVGPGIGVKASGGVRDAATARKLIAAGASRIGASASVEIVSGKTSKGSY